MTLLFATGPEGEMTKEEVSAPVEADTVLGWASFHQPSVIHQVASAPMPNDCGEETHTFSRCKQ